MWFTAFAVFLLFSEVQSQQQCSDSLGTCSGSRASLMQVKSLSQKLQASTGRGASTHAQTLAGFQKYTTELVDQYLQDPPPTGGTAVGPEVRDAINVILSYLDKLYVDLLYFHDQDILDAQFCADVPQNCENDHFNSSVKAIIDDLENQVNDLKSTHQDCRVELAETCSDPSCPVYHAYRKGDMNAFLPECAKHGRLAHQASEGNDLVRFEDCLNPTQLWLDPLYDHYVNCRCPILGGGEGCKDEEPEEQQLSVTCASKQTHFEDKDCHRNTLIGVHCQNYDSCIHHGQQHCNGEGSAEAIATCTRISANSQARQADNETAERIRCLLAVLVSSDDERATGLVECHEHDYTAVNAFWQIPCAVGEGDPDSRCPAADDHCIAIDQYYDTMGWTTRNNDEVDACYNGGAYTEVCTTCQSAIDFEFQALCQGQCYAAHSTPWETKCAFVQDPWDGTRPHHPCAGCSECEAEADYKLSGPQQGCSEGADLLTEQECHSAAQDMGLYFHAWNPGVYQHRFCGVFADEDNKVFWNTAGGAQSQSKDFMSVCHKEAM